jgi:DNA mismatch repair protein MutS2
MHAGALQALEFDRIVEALSGFAVTPLGAARLAALRPQTDPRRVSALLSATTEGVRFLETEGRLPLRAPGDLDAVLAALAIEGRGLEPLRLVGLADFLESIENARGAIRRTAPAFPALRAIADGAASFKTEIADVREKIDPGGSVVDNASAELRAVRDRLRRLRGRLQGLLESFVRGKDTARYLQEQIVTDRNGRYVLMIRAEHRAAIPGIIHGSSASGATLFLEPLSTVELNNEIVALEEQEAEEVRRILLALTNGFRSRPADVQRTVASAVELDVIQAKAEFSHLVGGSEPAISADGALELRSARHPLLIAAVVARLAHGGLQAGANGPRGDADNGRNGEFGSDLDQSAEAARATRPPAARTEPVPVDILLAPPTTVLMITGPNTGGKTVALKTAGLLTLMAQAGLHICAAPGSRLPVFRSVFADIGDEQSIAASLSTFSWHITNIASMDRRLSLPALVLLDEIGVGTDPVEGGALGIAIIDYFRRRGALVVATTHYEALKSYASTTEGAVAAGFGFDPDTFAPTYHLSYGSPGRSLALEISGRLGLNAAILAAARANISDREAQLAAHLKKVDEDLRALEHERRLVAREREAMHEAETRLQTREAHLREREDATRRRSEQQIDEQLRNARREIDAVVDDLKRRVAELAAKASRERAAAPVSTGETGAVRGEAMNALDQAASRIRGSEDDAPQADRHAFNATAEGAPHAGDRVAVATLGLEGRLVMLSGADAEVDVLGKRLRVPASELRLLARGTAAVAGRVNVNVHVQSRDDAPSDLNVIGCTVDEALTRTEKFLDDTLLTDQRTVRLIHGYGTGQLRRALAEFLQRHPLVTHFTAAAPEQGGGGVTVVELKE